MQTSTLQLATPRSARRGRGRCGFTLVEILIVVVILGILAAVVSTRFSSASEDAAAAAAQTDLKHMQTQVMLHANKNGGRYPEEITVDTMRSWFGKVEPHPFATSTTPLGVDIDASGNANVKHPAEKSIGDDRAGWWYNPANGIVRSRVKDLSDDEATLDMYRVVNITSIGSLADLD